MPVQTPRATAASSSTPPFAGGSRGRAHPAGLARRFRRLRQGRPTPRRVPRVPALAQLGPPTTSRSPSRKAPISIRRPRRAAAHAHHRVVELLRCLHALPRHTNHPLGSATPLRRGITHPGPKQALCFQSIYGRIKSPNRAPLTALRLDLFANSRAVSLVAEPRRRGDQEVFKLAKHR